jgi:hypothetical protein
MEQWQAEMRRLKIKHLKGISKEYYRLSGGDNMAVKPYKDGTTPTLEKCITDYLGYMGYCSTPTKVPGMKFHVKSVESRIGPTKIAISILARKGTKPGTTDYKDATVDARGRLHFIAHDMASFMQWFKQTFGSIQD